MFNLFMCALVGMVFSFLRKYRSLRTQGKSIDLNFKVSDYIKLEFDVMAMQLLAVIALLLVWRTVLLPLYPKLDYYAEAIFIVYGIIGSEVLVLVASKSQKYMTDKLKDYDNNSK